MRKIDNETKEKIFLYIKYFVTSFVTDELSDKEKDIILKCFLYKKSQNDIKKMIESVNLYKKQQ